MSTLISVLSTLGVGSILLYFVKRYFDRRDEREKKEQAQREAQDKASRDELDGLINEVKTSLETIRLLAYARMSEETERLLNKGYASPSERRILDEMYSNYRAHGWNGDMDSRLKRVYALPTIDLDAAKKEG